MAARRERVLLVALVLAGAAGRLFLLFRKPLWADEIFTLDLARRSLSVILQALRVDSGPPLHYLASHALLLPFGPGPGPEDVLVRALSVVASLLHLPLFFRVARRLGRADLGWPAAALFSVFPLAVDYAAEGRAYALASLLILLAFERALAVRDEPRPWAVAGLAGAAGAAVLTHYLAVFPVAGLVFLLHDASPAGKKALFLSGALAALAAAAWLPVALHQPAAAMAWSRTEPFQGAPLDFPINLALGLQAPEAWRLAVLPLAIALLAAVLFFARKGPLGPVAGVLGLGMSLLLAAQAITRSILLPERSALVFLPFVALLVAAAPAALRLAAFAAALLGLAVRLPALDAPTPGKALAVRLEPQARAGRTVCAVGLWGPELDYRLRRAGIPGRVVLFPSTVREHPGWYREEDLSDAALGAEAAALVTPASRPALYVLPRGSRASAALREQLAAHRPGRLLSSAYAEVLAIRGTP